MSDSHSRHSVFSEDDATLTNLLQHYALDSSEPLVTQIYRILRDEIVAIRLQPGQLVSEKEIADVLSASKTPVREALIRLENDGLVEVIPKSGTYVTQIRINKYMEACFTRLQLEIGAVQRAATHGAEAQNIELLESLLLQQQQALEASDYEQFFALDQALHQSFFQIAGVPGVWDLLLKTQADVNRMRHLKRIKNIRRGPAVIEEHRAIVAAISRQDAAAATQALIAHIGSLDKEIERLSSNPSLLEFIENQGSPSRRTRSARRSAS